MIRNFNCGLCFCLITKKKNLKKISKYFDRKYKPYVIGKVIRSKQKVLINENIKWWNKKDF